MDEYFRREERVPDEPDCSRLLHAARQTALPLEEILLKTQGRALPLIHAEPQTYPDYLARIRELSLDWLGRATPQARSGLQGHAFTFDEFRELAETYATLEFYAQAEAVAARIREQSPPEEEDAVYHDAYCLLAGRAADNRNYDCAFHYAEQSLNGDFAHQLIASEAARNKDYPLVFQYFESFTDEAPLDDVFSYTAFHTYESVCLTLARAQEDDLFLQLRILARPLFTSREESMYHAAIAQAAAERRDYALAKHHLSQINKDWLTRQNAVVAAAHNRDYEIADQLATPLKTLEPSAHRRASLCIARSLARDRDYSLAEKYTPDFSHLARIAADNKDYDAAQRYADRAIAQEKKEGKRFGRPAILTYSDLAESAAENLDSKQAHAFIQRTRKLPVTLAHSFSIGSLRFGRVADALRFAERIKQPTETYCALARILSGIE